MQVLKSRTTWTIAVTFLINGVSAIHNNIPAGVVPLVDAGLGLLAIYFHVNPSQNYKQ